MKNQRGTGGYDFVFWLLLFSGGVCQLGAAACFWFAWLLKS